MSRAVFAQTDGVVGVDHHLTLFHQRGHTYRVTRVFHEHQEGGGVRQEAAVQRDTVGDSGHTELAHAVVDVVPGSVFVDRLRARPQGQVGRREICGAAEEFRQQRAEGFDGVLRGFTAGDFRRVGLQLRDELVSFRVEVRRHLAFHTAGEFGCFLREGFGVSRKLLVPCGFFRWPASLASHWA